jgi:hypothetical protein
VPLDAEDCHLVAGCAVPLDVEDCHAVSKKS